MTQSTYNGTGPVPISASQLTTFATCRRAWAYEKLEGITRPETGATNDGTAIHNEVECYFKNGTAPERPEAKALLGLCPPRAEHLVAEAEFTLAWPGEDALLRGKIDLVDPVNHVIYDHKTTSNIDRYAKSEEDLATDAQTVLYGVAYRAVFDNRDEVQLQWNYVKREQPRNRPPQTRPVTLTQNLEMLEAGLLKWRPVVADLVQIAKRRPKAVEVEASPGEACFKYGGCHFKDLCPDYAGHRKVKEVDPVSPEILAKLAALSSSTPAPLPESRAEVVEVPPESRQLIPLAAPPPPVMPLLDSVRIALDIAPSVVPPDAQPNVSPTEPAPPPVVEVKRGRGRPKGSVKVARVDAAEYVASMTTPEADLPDSVPMSVHPTQGATRHYTHDELITVIDSTIWEVRNEPEANLDQRIEAAKLAVALLGLNRV